MKNAAGLSVWQIKLCVCPKHNVVKSASIEMLSCHLCDCWIFLFTGKAIGETILYFGCRYAKEDFIYEEELQEYKNEGVITKLYAAFSRDQKEKVYVQHLMKANIKEIWKVLQDGGHLYVCGYVDLTSLIQILFYKKMLHVD